MPAMKQQAHSVLDALGVHLPASGDLSVRSPIDGSVLAQLPTASAVSGVFSDGFHTQLSPATRAKAEFQAHPATA